MSKKKTNPTEKSQDEHKEVSANSEQEALQQQISDLNNSLKEQDEKFIRLYAEFDNYRKRSTKEKADYLTNASKEIIVALLPILDDFERAVVNNEKVEDPQVLKDGFTLIYHKMQQLMEAKGLKAMSTINEVFDYDLHEAIANVPVENADQKGKVIDQVEKGYYLNDKVIRYAKVVVGQ
jgi:molecular chaperone GrpE